MKIAFMTLGCKLNYAETSTYQRGFEQAGLEVVPWQQAADIYLINTCSVTATSDSKSRNLIRKVHRINPAARIVVTGCSAQLRRSEIEAIDGVWRVFGSAEKSLVVPETLSRLSAVDGGSAPVPPPAAPGLPIPLRFIPASAVALRRDCSEDDVAAALGCSSEDLCHPVAIGSSIDSADTTSNMVPVFGAYGAGDRTRAFLKVQDGCDNHCLYCTVPLARGDSRNIPVRECVRMAEEIAASGIKEIVITGVNTGDFGKTTGESFLDLLKELNSVQGIERYRISSIEPNLLGDDIIDWIATGTKIQPHFHIPLQTGCDELLRAMGRRYDTAFFESKISTLRSKLGDGVFIGIDVMVGLPGETDQLFARTVAFLEKVHPAFIHVFPYSRRPGTPAASMGGQVSEQVKKQRVSVLEALCSRLHEEFVASQKGTRVQVLFESKEKGGTMSGYSGNYIRVTRPYDPALVGQITEIEL
ncbi:MAG: tRNA (N(6)-L-threonylcarbamoyladenosine(37)-C(2))-methylthiotransferase MtaB [Candidatus Cryptobacteroides sp.]